VELSTIRLVVQTFGDSSGMLLPADAVRALGVKAGDALLLVETPTGFQLIRRTAEFDETMRIADACAVEHREVRRRLAE